jgi:hypothetical protein
MNHADQLVLAYSEPDLALGVVVAHPAMFRADFRLWLMKNWGVWTAFSREAQRVWAAGRRHYSARTIGEYLRHQTAVREREGEFKVNDWWWPDLARLYMELHPQCRGFFETRVSPASRRAA